MWAKWSALSWVACAAVAGLLAQVEMGRITGTVVDSTGAVIPGAEVRLVHLQTNREFVAVTNDRGRYFSVPIPIGSYRVEAELPGFKRTVRSGIRLEIQQTVTVDLTLQVGEVTDQVEVVGTAPLLNTTEAAQGQVIDNQQMVDLPLNGRDYVQLALLSAGTTVPLGRFGGFSSSGQRTTQNNYMIDGIDNNSLQIAGQSRTAEVVKPSVDAVQEFKVNTNTYSAEFGRATGGVLNLTIKSGTNEFHGTLFEFHRNEALDAKNFFDRPDQPKPPFKRNQFGFSLGGPIVRDKTFFFGDWEGTRIRESATIVSTIPTRKMRLGDFSELNRTIYDPETLDPQTNTRQPFPNARIPQDRFDAVAAEVNSWWPEPQNNQLTRNFVFNPPVQTDIDKFDIRVDHLFSSQDSIFYRFSASFSDTPPIPPLPPPAWGGSLDILTLGTDGINTALGWNHTFSPTFLVSTRLGWNRIFSERRPPVDTNVNAEIGLKGVDQVNPGGAVFGLSGMRSIGLSNFSPNLIDSQNRQAKSDFTWIRGDHSVKFGFDAQRVQGYITNNQWESGTFSFNGAFTRDPRTLRGGHTYADFLLGLPVSSGVSNNVHMNIRAWWLAGYLQDQWQLTPQLTWNWGLRYEVFLPWTETRGRLSNWDLDTNPSQPRWLIAGKTGRKGRFDQALEETDFNNFAPRLGLAYQLTPKTVVRAGGGIFYGNWEPTGGGEWLQTNPPMHFKVQLVSDSLRPNVRLQEGIPEGTLSPENIQNVVLSSTQIDAAWPLSYQWTLNIQHELFRDWVWEVGYYGNRAQNLVIQWDANWATPGPGPVNSRRRFTSTPFPGREEILMAPLARMNRRTWDGNSLFHSLQTRFERRFSTGFSLLGSYIWSKTLGDTCGVATSGNAPGCSLQDPTNRRADRALDNQHRTHRAVLSYIWQLPFGQGQRWGNGWSGPLDALLGRMGHGGNRQPGLGHPLYRDRSGRSFQHGNGRKRHPAGPAQSGGKSLFGPAQPGPLLQHGRLPAGGSLHLWKRRAQHPDRPGHTPVRFRPLQVLPSHGMGAGAIPVRGLQLPEHSPVRPPQRHPGEFQLRKGPQCGPASKPPVRLENPLLDPLPVYPYQNAGGLQPSCGDSSPIGTSTPKGGVFRVLKVSRLCFFLLNTSPAGSSAESRAPDLSLQAHRLPAVGPAKFLSWKLSPAHLLSLRGRELKESLAN